MSWATPGRVKSQSIWISDDLLRDAFNRFCTISASRRASEVSQCRRHACSTPGPLESRRRLARRRLNVAAHTQPSSPPLCDPFQFWSSPAAAAQPHWSWEEPYKVKPSRWFPPSFPSWLLDPPPASAPGPQEQQQDTGSLDRLGERRLEAEGQDAITIFPESSASLFRGPDHNLPPTVINRLAEQLQEAATSKEETIVILAKLPQALSSHSAPLHTTQTNYDAYVSHVFKSLSLEQTFRAHGIETSLALSHAARATGDTGMISAIETCIAASLNNIFFQTRQTQTATDNLSSPRFIGFETVVVQPDYEELVAAISDHNLFSSNGHARDLSTTLLLKLESLPLSAPNLQTIIKIVSFGLARRFWIRWYKLVRNAVIRILFVEIQSHQQGPGFSSTLFDLLNILPQAIWRRVVKDVSGELIRRWKWQGQSHVFLPAFQKWLQTLTHCDVASLDEHLSIIDPLYRAVFSQIRPSDCPQLLEALDPLSQCRVLLRAWLLPIHDAGQESDTTNATSIGVSSMSESMFESRHAAIFRDINQALEALEPLPTAITTAPTTDLDSLYKNLADDSNLYPNDWSHRDFRCPDDEPISAERSTRLPRRVLPFVVTLEALLKHGVPMHSVQRFFEELCAMLYALDRPAQLDGFLRGVQVSLQLAPTAQTLDIAEKYITRIGDIRPDFALRMVQTVKTFPLSRAPNLLEQMIAGSNSWIHPRHIISLILEDREAHDTAGHHQVEGCEATTGKRCTLTAAHISQVHDAAILFARASRFSARAAWTNVWRLWNHLRSHHAPMDARMSRALVIAGILRRAHKHRSWTVKPLKLDFILAAVRALEGDDMADVVERITRKAQRAEGIWTSRERLRLDSRLGRSGEAAAKQDDIQPRNLSWRVRMRERELLSLVYSMRQSGKTREELGFPQHSSRGPRLL